MRPLLARSSFHLGVLAMVAFALWWSTFDRTRLAVPVPALSPVVQATVHVRRVVEPGYKSVRGVERPAQVQRLPRQHAQETLVQSLIQAPVPRTIIPQRPRSSIITYTVAADDNLFTIAEQFSLLPDTIIWANQELQANPDLMYTGQVLTILPIDGIYHTVAEGETLLQVAEQYSVTVASIVQCAYNDLDSHTETVSAGKKLVVPGGIKSFHPEFIRSFKGTVPPDAARGHGDFVWPVGGHISQGYWDLHRAIDIAGPHGETVVAADAGFVTYAAWDIYGYGNLVVIDHGNGFSTYYAHLYGFYVDAGQSVERGQPIGARGTTGRSTGPHLHFEIRYEDIPRSPMAFLP